MHVLNQTHGVHMGKIEGFFGVSKHGVDVEGQGKLKSKGNRTDVRSKVMDNDVGRSNSMSKSIVRVHGLIEIQYYAMLAKVGVHHYNGNNVNLGIACGR
ncbi:hypothetical protein KIW84_011314 [Lathyrus oleraceus]|uniref:Uncharacterized protein n=1 Tax=Pisum sativum TaxID=3888 RepID=A0A9D4YM90_PEA|nr:hypothetical protein KIW84_011314 [Pisum sativum]